MLRLLRQAVDEFGQTVVMVTHEAHAAAYADRLVVLRDGQVAHDGDAGDEGQVIELMKAVGLIDMRKLILRGLAERRSRARGRGAGGVPRRVAGGGLAGVHRHHQRAPSRRSSSGR